jgi:cytochrome P450
MTGVPAATAPAFEPRDRAFVADPYPTLHKLRRHSPVTRLEDRGAWAVTGYAQVRSLLRDPRSGFASATDEPVRSRDTGGEQSILSARDYTLTLFSLWMQGRPSGDHARLRRLARGIFSPSAVAAWQERIQGLVDERVEQALAHGGMDVIEDLGRPLALTIAAEFVGIPAEVQPALGGFARELAHRLDVWPTPAGRERGVLAVAALAPHLRELVREWRSAPSAEDNLLSSLARASAEGALSEEEAVSHAAIFFFAGHVTTQHVIGNGVLALLQHPDQWELLRARPEAIGTAVEEFLRYDTPGPVAQRVATEDIEIDGQTIARGDLILLLLAGANRDPAVFSEPDSLDVTRSPNLHLSFGHGPYHCLGAAFARLEAKLAIGTLVRRLPPPRLATAALEWEDTFVVRGLRSLPIVFP